MGVLKAKSQLESVADMTMDFWLHYQVPVAAILNKQKMRKIAASSRNNGSQDVKITDLLAILLSFDTRCNQASLL